MMSRGHIMAFLLGLFLVFLANFARLNRTVVNTTALLPHSSTSSSSSSTSSSSKNTSSTSSTSSTSKSDSTTSASTSTSAHEASMHTVSTHPGNCTIHFQPTPRQDDGPQITKPLWVPTFPNSAGPPVTRVHSHDTVLRNLVASLTGYGKGAKKYEIVSSFVNRCRSRSVSRDVVVTCATGHPVLGVRPPPEQQKDDFSNRLILHIRNPRTNIPAYANSKILRTYPERQQPHQQHFSEDEWRLFRDVWLVNALNDWINFFKYWLLSTSYTIGVFLDYDQILHHDTGVILTQKVAQLLQQSNFETSVLSGNHDAPTDDHLISCIWHHSVANTLHRESHFQKHVPGYTADQKEYMIQTLESFRQEILSKVNGDGDDDDRKKENYKEFAQLLQTYIDDIRQNTKLDRPYSNETMKPNHLR